MIILKCIECGNTFQKDCIALCDVIACPICEAQYEVVATTDGKLRLKDFVVDESDFGEL
jgi:hypothetical protein